MARITQSAPKLGRAPRLVRFARQRQLSPLIPYLGRYRGALAVGALMVLLTNIAAVSAPWILRSAIDDLAQSLTRNKLLFYAAMILGISLVEGGFRFLMRRILIGVSRKIEFDLRNDLFRHLQSLTLGFFQSHPTGDLMARATNDLSAVRSVLGPGIMYSLNTLFTTLLAVTLLVRIHPQLALLTLIPLLAVGFSVRFFGKRIHERFEKIQEQFSELTTQAQENVSGIRVVQAYNQESAAIERFRQAADEYIRRSLSLVRISGLVHPLLQFLLGISAVGLIFFGGQLVMAGTISLGDFVAFMAYLAMLTWPTIALGWVINVVERGAASMQRINQLLETRPEIEPRFSAGDLAVLRGHVEVRNLNFSYTGRPVLRDLSLEIQAGQTLAIVGPTGSGKSTLSNLLCHLFPVPRGTIFFDGRDINDISPYHLRGQLAYVPQDTFLFSETILANISFGRVEAGKKETEAAARISDVWEDIQGFPQGFDTLVGERGITLSSGQKQRVAISRALLLDAPILILDDALSSVDTETEENILQGLAREIAGRTTILISHRVSTVQGADRIVVLEQGAIVEKGTHEQLLSLKGHYADLYQKQLLREELGIP